jgi:hypothetical protein
MLVVTNNVVVEVVVGHGVFPLVDSVIVQWVGDPCESPCDTSLGVHPHRCLQVVVGIQVVVCIRPLTSDPTITSKAKQSGPNGAPLCLGQGDSAKVQGQDVGTNSHGVFPLVDSVIVAGGWGLL